MARAKKSEEPEVELTRAEKEAVEDGEDLAKKYVEEQENRDEDDPLKLQKRDEEDLGEAVPVGAPLAEPSEDED